MSENLNDHVDAASKSRPLSGGDTEPLEDHLIPENNLAEEFKVEMSEFLSEIGLTRFVWSVIPSTNVAYELFIPKAEAGGFDITIEAYDFGVYPSVDDLELAPLDAMANFEIEWCKRFLFSVLSDESSYVVLSKNGVPYRRTLHYFDAWSESREEYSDPKWFYKFWSRGETKTLQNRVLDIRKCFVKPRPA